MKHFLRCLLVVVLSLPNTVLALECIAPSNTDVETGRIRQIAGPDAQGRWLIVADEGLFQFADDRVTPVKTNVPIGWVSSIARSETEGRWLIGASQGLFLLAEGQLTRVSSDVWPGPVWRMSGPDAQGRWLISASKGLFLFADAQLTSVAVSSDVVTGEIIPEDRSNMIAGPDRDGRWLIGTDARLLQFVDDRITRVSSDVVTGGVGRISSPDAQGRWLIDTTKGLFLLADAQLTPVTVDPDVLGDTVYEIAGPDRDGRWLIGALGGLFQFAADQLTPITDDRRFYGFLQIADPDTRGHRLTWTRRGGFFLIADTQLTPVTVSPGLVGWVDCISDPDAQGRWLIGGDARLFQFHSQPIVARAATQLGEVRQAIVDEPEFFEWTITHPCSRMISASELKFTPLGDRVKLEVLPDHTHNQIRVQVSNVVFPERGIHEAALTVLDQHRKETHRSPVEVHVSLTVFDALWWHAKQLAPWLLAAHTLLFVGLIVGARWSGWCWRVVTDPVWGRFGIWFYFALRHFGGMQRWCLGPWFARCRAGIHSSSYLPVPMAGPKEEQLDSLALIARLKKPWKNLWVQGNAGMGKTAFVGQLEQAFFGGPKSEGLVAAYRRYGFVPLVVAMRKYRAIIPDGGEPENWVPEMARAALAAKGFPVTNKALFHAMLSNGGFALVLDGANEVGHGMELELHAQREDAVRVLVTSQAVPIHAPDAFAVWRLPANITNSVEPLVKLYLKEDRGGAVFERIKDSRLLGDIRSGYDVRLLTDLLGSEGDLQAIPSDRVGLYERILDELRLPDGSPYPVERLCKASWAIWRDGEREFSADSDGTISPAVLEPLRVEGRKVVRALDGQRFEFRHDQMRGYLAARWAAQYEVSPIALFEHDATIWRHARTEQEVVWGFFADLVDKQRGVQVWKWCNEDVERAVLQHALFQRGGREGWVLRADVIHK